VTRILTLLDDVMSSTSSRTKVPEKKAPRNGRYLKSARRQNTGENEETGEVGEKGEREGEGGEDMNEGRERNNKRYTTDRIQCRRENNREEKLNNRGEELHLTVDPLKPMTAPDPLRASTLDLQDHPVEEHLLLPKQGGEEPVFRLNTVRYLMPYLL
jgi:hypothetical protein